MADVCSARTYERGLVLDGGAGSAGGRARGRAGGRGGGGGVVSLKQTEKGSQVTVAICIVLNAGRVEAFESPPT